MSYNRVRNYFDEKNLSNLITEHELTGDTVEHAAEIIGCTLAEIAKSLTFLVDQKPVMVVMSGDARINSSKFKSKFHQKPSFIPREKVEDFIGHKPGAVCPFVVNEGVPIYLDVSLRRFTQVHTAAGIDTATICVGLTELEQYSHALEWVDVCKGWYIND